MTQLEEYQIRDIEDTMRRVSNLLNAPSRETCLKRDIMLCWNWLYDALHDVPSEKTSDRSIDYRMKIGQTPYSK